MSENCPDCSVLRAALFAACEENARLRMKIIEALRLLRPAASLELPPGLPDEEG